MLRDPGLIPLSHDHQHALALCVLTDRALLHGESARAAADRVLEQFDSEILAHFRFEEEVLFPMLASLPVVAELIEEHRTLESLITALRTEPTQPAIQEFCRVLRVHVRKEESSLFEQAQHLLTREQLDEIGRRHRNMM